MVVPYRMVDFVNGITTESSSRLEAPHSGEFSALSWESGVSTGMGDDEVGTMELPQSLSVLFVDDDRIIRRLFCRALENAAPTWSITQAANGETALQMVQEKEIDSSSFGIIIIDQYMASVHKEFVGNGNDKRAPSYRFPRTNLWAHCK